MLISLLCSCGEGYNKCEIKEKRITEQIIYNIKTGDTLKSKQYGLYVRPDGMEDNYIYIDSNVYNKLNVGDSINYHYFRF